MNDFCLEQTNLGFEGLGCIPLLKLPPLPPPGGNPSLNFSLYKDLLTDNQEQLSLFYDFLCFSFLSVEIKINDMCSFLRWRLGPRWPCGAWEESDCL